MPEKCVHMTSGCCTTCQALDQALAELQRVRGQRDRLESVLGIVAAEIKRVSAQHDGDPADPAGNVSSLEMTSHECRDILSALAHIAARP